MEDILAEFAELLEDSTGEQQTPVCEDGTYEIDAASFTLSFTLSTTTFEVRKIEVRVGRGLGHRIMEAIHALADTFDLIVIASKVEGKAVGFWRQMGYDESSRQSEFYRMV